MEALMTTVFLKGWPWNPPRVTINDSFNGTWVFDDMHYDWRHFWRRTWVVTFSRSNPYGIDAVLKLADVAKSREKMEDELYGPGVYPE